ncbi:MAG: ribose-5-phosphate isomerase RpiA [Planctomycetes bacterium]|nr:ribose-5-phosphate isomerase RpiA [Planctomycetota bacterium]
MSSGGGPDPADLDRVALAALERVKEGMNLGLGTGKAAEAFIQRLGERVKGGLRVRGVPTSERSDQLMKQLGIPFLKLEEVDGLDLAFDGADEVTPDLCLTKGLGGALLRERVVAHEARTFIVLVTPEKLVPKLGTRTHVPIEVVPFARGIAAKNLTKVGGKPAVRKRPDGSDYYTDNQNLILDTTFAPIDDPVKLDASIRRIPGVVDTGFFLGMAGVVLVGEKGAIRELKRKS